MTTRRAFFGLMAGAAAAALGHHLPDIAAPAEAGLSARMGAFEGVQVRFAQRIFYATGGSNFSFTGFETMERE